MVQQINADLMDVTEMIIKEADLEILSLMQLYGEYVNCELMR